MRTELLSMTGFGRAVRCLPGGELRVEARSVNHRSRDVRVSSTPRNLAWEHAVQKIASAAVARGKLDIRVEWIAQVAGGDADLAAWTRLRGQRWRARTVLGTLPPWPSDDVAARPDVPEAELAAVVTEALAALNTARAAEGKALAAVLQRHLDDLSAAVVAYRAGLDTELAARRANLRARIAALAEQGLSLEDQRRIAEEVAMQLIRGDVHEELDRLDAHIDAMRALLAAPEVAAGRRLDVLVQEQGREAHTLASKSVSPTARAAALNMRTIIERLREQIQNIE